VKGILALTVGLLVAAGGMWVTHADDGGNLGKALFERRCTGCHALDRDKSGPRLGDLKGRLAGSVTGFEYSSSLKNSGLTWNRDTLDRWPADPDAVVPGNDMAFRLANEQERAAVIDYLLGQ